MNITTNYQSFFTFPSFSHLEKFVTCFTQNGDPSYLNRNPKPNLYEDLVIVEDQLRVDATGRVKTSFDFRNMWMTVDFLLGLGEPTSH